MHIILAFREVEASLDYVVTLHTVFKNKTLPQTPGRLLLPLLQIVTMALFLIKPAPTAWDVTTHSQVAATPHPPHELPGVRCPALCPSAGSLSLPPPPVAALLRGAKGRFTVLVGERVTPAC